MVKDPIKSHCDLVVYRMAFDIAMKIFELTKSFPAEERYSLTDQIRRSSRSVCANISEGWRKRRYHLAFISKLCDSEAEAAETQTWLEFSLKCKYINNDTFSDLYQTYNNIIGKLVNMINNPKPWLLPVKK
ncbi:MAG TPA: four helix bundle protein [Deltaproteobacteria bacterium]|nr:four helix bundle protein [Deltaproteobacteria bacterium]